MSHARTMTVGMALAVAACLAAGGARARGQEGRSKLWGDAGELWSPGSRLPDFSYAGYRRGEKAIPDRSPGKTVRDFGARGDGEADDTEAFRRALEAGRGGVTGVPAGRYVITGILSIDASGTVLKGEGPDRSVLVCPRPLEEIRPRRGQRTDRTPTSNYSWSGGFVEIRGRGASQPIARVVAPARRGAFELRIDPGEVGPIKVGDDVRLVQRDPGDESLIKHVFAGDSGPVDELKRFSATFLARVAEIDAARGRVRIDRPLRTDVRLEWEPTLRPAEAGVEEAGIEGIGFTFPVRPYEGHFSELGSNAIAVQGARNCWIRDVTIRHADSGIFVSGDNITLSGIVLVSDRPPDRSLKSCGHHGIALGGTDNLLTDFDFRCRFIHDVTVSHGTAGNVVSNGRAVDLSMDHHGYGVHANLWTDIDAGAGSRLFLSGGGSGLGWHSGAWETFWRIRTDRPQDWPRVQRRGEKWGCDLMNLVGLTAESPSTLDPGGRWFETIPPARLAPANLHEAQLDCRLARGKTATGKP
jgi:hypothetical protein